MTGTTRVVKIGGSLFDREDLREILAEWIAVQVPAHNVVIAGGGPMADVIRHIDQRYQLNPEDIHWACIGVMTASARLVAAMLPEAALVEDLGQLQQQLAETAPAILVFSVESFLRQQQDTAGGDALPCGWHVTSDSIAAHLATKLAAEELVLLKSRKLPSGTTRTRAAEAGLVDEFFPVASHTVPVVRWVNLRDEKGERLMPTE